MRSRISFLVGLVTGISLIMYSFLFFILSKYYFKINTNLWMGRFKYLYYEEDGFENRNHFVKVMESVQSERRLTLKRACQRFAIKEECKAPSRYIHDSALYSTKYKYSVCYLQKCGSSNWFTAVMVMDKLKTMSEMSEYSPNKVRFVQRERSYKFIENQTVKEEMWNEYIKIIQVRDPFERLVSAYNAKLVPGIEGHTSYYERISKDINWKYKPMRQNVIARTAPNDTTASFEDFVNHLVSSDNKDSHWELYNQFCATCEIDFDYIIKFETFFEDMKYLQIVLNIPNEDAEIFYNQHLSRTNSSMTKKLFDQIDVKLANDLYEVYKIDFETFGYEHPSWLC